MMLPSIFGKDLFNEMMNTSFEDDFWKSQPAVWQSCKGLYEDRY